MRKYQLAVVVKELEYVKRLIDYARDSTLARQWQIIAFTDTVACRQYVKQGHRIDLLAAQTALLAELDELADPRLID